MKKGAGKSENSEYVSSSYNKRLAFRRPFGRLQGSVKPCSGFALCTVLLHPHFGQGTFAAQSPLTCPKRRQPWTLYDKETKRFKV